MRAYLDAVHRCLLRRDRREAGRLLAHPCRCSLSMELRRSLLDTAAGVVESVHSRILRELDDAQTLMCDDDEDAPSPDALQLELPFLPAPWSRPISLTVARAARLTAEGQPGNAEWSPAERGSAWHPRVRGEHAGSA